MRSARLRPERGFYAQTIYMGLDRITRAGEIDVK